MRRQLSDCSLDELRQMKAELLESNLDRADLFYNKLSDINEQITRKYLQKYDTEARELKAKNMSEQNVQKYTQEQIDNRTSDYVCFDCGRPFLTEIQISNNAGHNSTFHEETCGLCNEPKGVCHMRTWNYLRLDTKN